MVLPGGWFPSTVTTLILCIFSENVSSVQIWPETLSDPLDSAAQVQRLQVSAITLNYKQHLSVGSFVCVHIRVKGHPWVSLLTHCDTFLTHHRWQLYKQKPQT